jgi:hypothetical protein
MAEKHDAETIRQLNTYVDDAGRRVNEFAQVFGKKKDPKFFKGEAVIVIQAPDPNVPPQHARIEFLFDHARTLQEAFQQFDEVAAAEKDRWVKEQTKMAEEAAKNQKGKIISIGKGAKKILGLDGRPLK